MSTGGAGAPGIIVITYTPAGGGGGSGPTRRIFLFEGKKLKIQSGKLIVNPV
jgi:hypothetical protein